MSVPDSAVRVFPTPGSPLSSMTKPRPVLVSLAVLLLVREPSTGLSIPTFAVNDIVELIVAGQLLLDKGTDDVLVPMRKNKPGERVLAPANWQNVLNIELG